MKVQNITYNNTLRPAFKKYISYEDYYCDDYGIYNKHISIKDVFISSSIVSGLLLVAGAIFTHKNELVNVVKKASANIKNTCSNTFDKIVWLLSLKIIKN